MSDTKNAVETWATWEVMFYPFPAEIQRHGFEKISDTLADQIHGRLDQLISHQWGDVVLSGERESVLTFTITEPGPEVVFGGRMRPSLAHVVIGDFQEDIAALVAESGFQGHITAERHLNVMRETRRG